MLFPGILFFLPVNANILAEIDGVPLRRETMYEESKILLPDTSLPDDVREVKIRAAVMTELKIRETLLLLKQENIPCSGDTACWYISERKREYTSNSEILENGLQKLIKKRSFQLKCAIYKYLYLRNPEKLRLAAGAAEDHYFRNQLQYRVNNPGVYKIITVHAGSGNAGDIRSAALQGESPESIAARFGTVCKVSTPQEAVELSRLNLKKGSVSEVVTLNNSLCVALCITPPGHGFIPFSQLKPLIEAELISRRAGAAFDEILQKRLSRKNIKYRR